VWVERICCSARAENRAAAAQLVAILNAGDIDYRAFQTIVYRTDLITDPDVLRRVHNVGERTVAKTRSSTTSGCCPVPLVGVDPRDRSRRT
jgi:hypothetical protein